jgi:PPOX class probable F420-dependent enzyme
VSTPTPSVELRGEAVLGDPLVQELLAARLIGVLASIEPDGCAHVVPMWVAPSDGAILLATGSRSRKVRNLERDPRATLVLHDSRPGAEVCGTSLSGRVEVVRGEPARPLVERVHARYVSETGLALPEVRDFLSSDDVALRFVPEAAVTWDERRSAAARALRETRAGLPLEPTTPR